MTERIRSLAEVEKEAIFNALRETNDVREAARLLGVGKTTLYRKLKAWGYGKFLWKRNLQEFLHGHVET